MNSKVAFDAAIESLAGYFKILAAVFVSTKLLNFERLTPESLSTIPYAMIIFEILAFFLIKNFGPKLKYSRLISGIIVFVSSFAIMFTSLGTGLVLFSMAALLCLLISLSKLSNTLGIALIPLISPTLYIKLILQAMDLDTPMNLIKLWKNNYIVLFIYPAFLLLCCQTN